MREVCVCVCVCVFIQDLDNSKSLGEKIALFFETHTISEKF